jgi:hypothetical protein
MKINVLSLIHQNGINMKTIEELNQIICDTVGIKIEDYNKMTISEQKKVGFKYMKMKFNLKPRNK